MVLIVFIFVELKMENVEEKASSENSFEGKKKAINESIEKFDAISNSLSDLCSKINEFVKSLGSLDKIAIPEVVGGKINTKLPRKHIFDSTEYLIETMKTFEEWVFD